MKATFAVVRAVREHPEIHDQYLAENPDKLGPSDQDKVRGWKDGVAGDFIVAKLLKKGQSWPNVASLIVTSWFLG